MANVKHNVISQDRGNSAIIIKTRIGVRKNAIKLFFTLFNKLKVGRYRTTKWHLTPTR